MRNLALDEKKRRDRRAAWSMKWPRQEERVATPDELLERSELEREFDLAVAGLPERRREIFLHARMNGLSNREIADVMGITPQTVANQLSAALATLRVALSPDSLERTRPSEPQRAHIART
jgi:RNA polymerase sigma-70 factor (ECF subfamily)